MKLNHGQVPKRFRVGFTLVELLVVIAILAILASIGLPSFQRILADYRVTSQVNAVQGLLQFARAEAVKRTAFVTVCSDGDALFVRVSEDCRNPPGSGDPVGSGDPDNLRVLPLDDRLTLTYNEKPVEVMTFAPSGYTANTGILDVQHHSPDITRTIRLIGSGFSEVLPPN